MNIFITGASRGIGREFVEQFLKKPNVDKIWITSSNTDRLQDLVNANPQKVNLISTCVSKPEAKTAIAQALQNETIDLLINNAGTYYDEPDQFAEVNLENVLKSFEVNTLSPMRVCQALIPNLKKSKNPKVVQVTSLMGSIDDNTSGGSYGYRISKAALNMFNKSFSIDFPFLTSIVVHPGWVKTDMGGDEAPIEKSTSVKGLIKVIDELTPEKTGKFFDFEGDELPW